MNFSYFFEITFGRQSNTVESFTMPDRATYAPRATIDAICRLPILLRAMSSAGTGRRRTSSRVTCRSSTRELLMIRSPPDASIGRNFSIEGPFMIRSPFGRPTTGEPISSSETTTVQFAVPPRISTPYAGK